MSETKILENYKYTEKHEWVKLEADLAWIGITDFAQNALGDLVYIDLPKSGKQLKASDSCGTLESVKAAEDVYAPISGEVIESNSEITKNPGLVNLDPYKYWMIKVKNFSKSEYDALMDSEAYKKYISSLG